jgi:hypothetical protein
LIAGLAVAALTAALALGPIADAAGAGSGLETATNLAYPICDLTLLTLVVTAAAFRGQPLAGLVTSAQATSHSPKPQARPAKSGQIPCEVFLTVAKSGPEARLRRISQ